MSFFVAAVAVSLLVLCVLYYGRKSNSDFSQQNLREPLISRQDKAIKHSETHPIDYTGTEVGYYVYTETEKNEIDGSSVLDKSAYFTPPDTLD